MHSVFEIFDNWILWASVVSWACAQIIKILIDVFRFQKINLALIISSGGMPSSHTSFVTTMTTLIGMTQGFDSAYFSICAILTLVVMYDAAGVRRAAGKQAAVINELVDGLENHGVLMDKKLKELLGHSPIEVAAGAILGVIIALILGGV